MVNIRIEKKPSFQIVGQKIWVSGQDNEIFEAFWKQAHESGLVTRLKSISAKAGNRITGSDVFGVSRVEKDPDNRAFYFYIAAEAADGAVEGEWESYMVPACTWAIFSNKGELPMSLIQAEMFAFMEWLPASPYQHAHAPELEVYPTNDSSLAEFWLPIAANDHP